MLAYRAEDISRRLVPQELYVREELEESVQFDVRRLAWGGGWPVMQLSCTRLLRPAFSSGCRGLSSQWLSTRGRLEGKQSVCL